MQKLNENIQKAIYKRKYRMQYAIRNQQLN